jgi:hypothetical protein
MREEEGFLNAIRQNPEDETTRLACARAPFEGVATVSVDLPAGPP